MKISFRSRQILLNYVNALTKAEDLVRIVKDDPSYGKRGYGIRASVAEALIEFRESLPDKQFTDTPQLLEVSGIGPDTYHDILTSFATLPAKKKAEIFINTEKDPEVIKNLIQDDPAGGSPRSVGITTEEAINLIELRSTQPNGEYPSLDAALKVSGIGPQTLHNLEYSFEESFPLGGAIARKNLAEQLKPFLSPDHKSMMILGNDIVAVAVEKLSGSLPEVRRDLLLQDYEEAVAAEAVNPEERVVDLVYFPQVSAVPVGPPKDIVDPASLPDISTNYRWFRSNAGLYLTTMAEAKIEFLTDDGWIQGLTVDHTFYVEPIKTGFRISKVSDGPLAPAGTGKILWEEAPAVRITCRGSIRGVLLGSPLSLKLDGKKPPIPCDWSYPNPEIWINPRPDLPWIGPGPQDSSGYLPGGVVVAGGACPPGVPEDDNQQVEGVFPSVLIATRPLVYVPGGEPWPWGPRRWPRRWDWPWFPGKGDDDGDDPRDVGGPFIFGEVIDTDLTVKIKGCPCIRRPEVEKYEAEPSLDGGSYQWSIDDEDIAEIEDPDNEKIVKVKSKDIGNAQLKVVYVRNGLQAEATMAIAVIYHKYTERDRPQTEKLALPVIQPSPKVRIAKRDPNHKHIETYIREHRAKFEIAFQGELNDALLVIETLEVLAGEDFRQKLSRSGNEYGKFDDEKFEVFKAEVYGPGRSYVRMLATNSIEFFGSDTLEIVIRIPPNWESIIDSLEGSRALFIDTGASQEEIEAYDRRLNIAWEEALKGVEFDYAWLNHTDNATTKAPANEKWSVAVEVDAKSGLADIETSDGMQSVQLEEKQEKLLAPENEPKNYFLIHGNYDKDLLTWDKDGLLHHQPGLDVNLIFNKEPCCAHNGPGVGVLMDPPGINIIEEGDPVILRAKGLPKEWNGVQGVYTWDCVAHPPGATFEFKPDGPTSRDDVEFISDTAGVYTFRVRYQLLDASGPWTHALGDGQIVFAIETITAVKRFGDYSGNDVKDHEHRPYYSERTEHKQRGAEISITNAKGGPLGKEFKMLLLCPQELEYFDSLTAKVYYTDATSRDFKIGIHPDFKFRASLTLRSAKAVERVHIIGIEYLHLPRMKSDAVWIDVQVKPLAPPLLDLIEAPASGAAANTVTGQPDFFPSTSVVVNDGDDPRDVFNENEETPSKPVVNLILRTQDMGDAKGSNAIIGNTTLGYDINVTNGNQYFQLELFQTFGMGLSPSPMLGFNSKAATRSEAIRLYGKYNGVKEEDLFLEFGRERCGTGWSSSFDMSLFEFIDVEERFGRLNLVKCAEVMMPDGNRIAFEEVRPNEYHVRAESEALSMSPGTALAMVLNRLPDDEQWRLQDVEQVQWLFDKEGKLLEKSDARTRLPNSQLAPMTWEWSETLCTVTDSSGRKTKAELNDKGFIKTIKTPEDKRFSLTHIEGQLKTIEMPLGVQWQFDYGEQSLMTLLKPPEGHPATFRHYLGEAVENVAKDIAQDYWGRIFRIDMGDRTLRIVYEQRVEHEEEQRLLFIDAEDHRWRYTYKQIRQAAKKIEYANNSDPDAFTDYAQYEYQSDTKLVRRHTDFHDATTYSLYVHAQQGKGRLLHSVTSADQHMQSYRYNDQDLMESMTDELSQIIRYQYYDDRQIKKVTYPVISVLNPALNRGNQTPYEEFTYDDYRRVLTYRSVDGITTTYGYGGAGDPHNTGQPTSITTGTHTQTLSWDLMGRNTELKTHFGFTTNKSYDDLGRLETASAGAATTTYEYDSLHRGTKISDNFGREASTKFNAYGEVDFFSNPLGGKKEFLERDDNGNVLEMKNEDGGVFKFEQYDAVGRYKIMKAPRVGRQGQNGLQTPDMPDAEMIYEDRATRYALANEQAYKVTEKRGSVTRAYYYNQRGLPIGEEESIGGVSKSIVSIFDPRGKLSREYAYRDDQRFGTLRSMRWDALGRLDSHNDGSHTTEFSTGRDSEGLYSVELLPSQDSQVNGKPATIRRFDDNNRIVAELDGNGVKTKEYRYDDSTHECRIFTLDPAADNGGLVHSSTLKYDQQENVVEQIDLLANITLINQYDDLGRLENTKAPSGTTEYTYDLISRIKEIKTKVPAAGGGVTVSGPHMPLPAATEREVVITHDYDKIGHLILKGTDSAKEEFEYDQLGRLIKSTQTGLGGPGTLTEELYYNDRGELTGRWLAPDLYTTYEYNHRNNQVTEIFHDRGLDWRQVKKHDLFGNITELRDDSHSYQFIVDYDRGNRMTGYTTRKDNQQISKVNLNYNQHARVDSVDVEYQNVSRRISYAYTGQLKLSSAQDSDIGAGGTYQWHYNDYGNTMRFRRAVDDKALTTYRFHANGRLKEMKHKLGDDWEDEFTLTIGENDYDSFGNPTKIAYQYVEDGTSTTQANFLESEEHQYDSANRLISSTFKGTKAGLFSKTFGDYGIYLRFLFPVAANLFAWLHGDTLALVKKDYAFDEFNRKTLEFTRLTPDLDEPDEQQVIVHQYKYGQGQAVEEEIQQWYDINASTPKTIRKKYLYDNEGRRTYCIETIRDASGNAWARMTYNIYAIESKPVRTLTYELRGDRRHWLKSDYFIYGPDGQMTWSRHQTISDSLLGDDDYTANLSSTYAEFADFDNAPATPAPLPQRDHQFHYVYAGDSLIALLDKDGKLIEDYLNGDSANNRIAMRRAGDSFDYYNNYQGSSLLLTDDDGDIEERFPQTGTYGESIKKVPQAVHAGMWANLTSFVQTPARHFDPGTGQFSAPDPIGLAGGINRYTFANNNPVTFKDSSGNYIESAWDVASLGVGLWSFSKNVEEGNFWSATIDLVGIGVDAVALALPIPGGAGAAIKAYRAGEKIADAARAAKVAYQARRAQAIGLKVAQFIDRSIGIGQGIYMGGENVKKGDALGAFLSFGLSAIGISGFVRYRRDASVFFKGLMGAPKPEFRGGGFIFSVYPTFDYLGRRVGTAIQHATSQWRHWRLEELSRELQKIADEAATIAMRRMYTDPVTGDLYGNVYGKIYMRSPRQHIALFVGNMVDYTFKRIVEMKIRKGRFADFPDLSITPARVYGADSYSRVWDAAWDITTGEAAKPHVLKYELDYNFLRILDY